MPAVRIDLETRSILNLKKVGVYVYAVHPLTDVWCAACAVDDEPVNVWVGILPDAGCPDVIRRAVSERWPIHAHNANFERMIWRHKLTPKYGWPAPTLEQWRCSMATCLAAALPGELDGAAAALNLPIRKDAEGHRLMLLMAKPRDPRPDEDQLGGPYWHNEPEKQSRLQRYAMRDVEVERAIDNRVPPLTDAEQRLWQLDAVVNEHGFYTEGALLKAGSCIEVAANQGVQEELARLTSGALVSTNQTDRLKTWLAERGCEVK
jgi:DNA polymerase